MPEQHPNHDSSRNDGDLELRIGIGFTNSRIVSAKTKPVNMFTATCCLLSLLIGIVDRHVKKIVARQMTVFDAIKALKWVKIGRYGHLARRVIM